MGVSMHIPCNVEPCSNPSTVQWCLIDRPSTNTGSSSWKLCTDMDGNVNDFGTNPPPELEEDLMVDENGSLWIPSSASNNDLEGDIVNCSRISRMSNETCSCCDQNVINFIGRPSLIGLELDY